MTVDHCQRALWLPVFDEHTYSIPYRFGDGGKLARLNHLLQHDYLLVWQPDGDSLHG